MNKRKISLFVAGYFCLVGSVSAVELSQLTLEQKIGQVMIWSFTGTQYSPELEQTLNTYHPGALIVFRSNVQTPASIARLLAQAQKVNAAKPNTPPLFTMVDQEGGLVTRVRSPIPMPSALALAQMNSAEFIKRYARASADVLHRLGFNVDLAPVLDISNPKLDSFIGNRTFGDDPVKVTELTSAYSKGLSEGGLLPTAKHFPGHGGTTQDSHHVVPTKTSTLEELQAHDLIPFVEFTGVEYPRAVMMAHLALPKIDPSGVPATYSSVIIQERLRQALGYDGLVITDDLEMGGASFTKADGISHDIGERAVRAFKAGNDMLMLGGSVAHQRRAFDALKQAVRSGRITRERLDESVARILKAKSETPPAPRYAEASVNEAFKSLDQLSREVMHHNFKHGLEEATRKWPNVNRDTRVLVFSSGTRFYMDFEHAFNGQAKPFPLTPTTLAHAEEALKNSRADFAVFFASGGTTAKFLNRLTPALRAKLVVVNCNHPGEVQSQGDYLGVINLNSFFNESAIWMARALNQPRVDPRRPAGD